MGAQESKPSPAQRGTEEVGKGNYSQGTPYQDASSHQPPSPSVPEQGASNQKLSCQEALHREAYYDDYPRKAPSEDNRRQDISRDGYAEQEVSCLQEYCQEASQEETTPSQDAPQKDFTSDLSHQLTSNQGAFNQNAGIPYLNALPDHGPHQQLPRLQLVVCPEPAEEHHPSPPDTPLPDYDNGFTEDQDMPDAPPLDDGFEFPEVLVAVDVDIGELPDAPPVCERSLSDDPDELEE